MPFIFMLSIVAIGLPYLMAAFFEMSFDPRLWGWYSRAILAVIYMGFGAYCMPLLLKMARRYDELSNRKRDGY